MLHSAVKDSKLIRLTDRTRASYATTLSESWCARPRKNYVETRYGNARHMKLSDRNRRKAKACKPKRLIGARTRELATSSSGALKSVAPDLLANVRSPKQKRGNASLEPREAACFLRRVDEGRDPNERSIESRTNRARKGELLALRVNDLTPLLAASGLRKATREAGQDGQRKLPRRAVVSLCRRRQLLPSKAHSRDRRPGDDRLFPVGDLRVLTKQMQRTMRAAGVPSFGSTIFATRLRRSLLRHLYRSKSCRKCSATRV